MSLISQIDFAIVAYTIGVYAIIVVSPGPGFVLVSRLALRGDQAMCRGAVGGLAIAATIYALLAMIGLAAILSQIGWLARSVQIIGGLYLIYLGISSWMTAGADGHAAHLPADANGSFAKGLRTGLLVNLSNPKAITLFVSLYASIVPMDAHWSTRACILLAGLLMELIWLSSVAEFLSQDTFQQIYRKWSLWLDRCIGSILILLGWKLVFAKTDRDIS